MILNKLNSFFKTHSKKIIFSLVIIIATLQANETYTQRKLKEIERLEKAAERLEDSWGNNAAPYEKIKECNFISRPDFIKLMHPSLKSLEIGPYYTPVLKGGNVKYFDVLDKEHLIAKAGIDKLPNDNIPEIDYVEPTGDLSIIEDKFDVVFSSHNIEHQVDLIKHLNQVSNLLTNGGKFYLFIPDKRYCFDKLIAQTTLADVINAHETEQKTHSLRTILAMRCETTHNDTLAIWRKEPTLPTNMSTDCYKDAIQSYQDADGGYIDAHNWRFTPQSFKFIINQLNAMGLIDLKIESIFCTMTNSHEFEAILVKI